ncbi:MAG: endonuclease III [Thermodesulfovibrionales bacterium]
MTEKERLREIVRRLRKEYPEPGTALHFTTPMEILVATILSAQTTDAHVNKVTEKLFRKYRSVRDYADVPLNELTNDIRSVNFFNTKAKHIKAAAQELVARFGSEVPRTMDDLVGLPGVARKTANIVLSAAFGVNAGIAVDTHVRRLANRLGLSGHDDPIRIERDLMAVMPRKGWAVLSHLLIFHGRKVCQAKRMHHSACVIRDLCPSREL